jgi:ssDNA-binding Zn-finger/Zn-ribbon topoisomerase 1
MDGYCLKCKETRAIKDLKYAMTSNGRTMAKGVCPVCGTTINKFLSKADAEKVAGQAEAHVPKAEAAPKAAKLKKEAKTEVKKEAKKKAAK